MNPIHPLAEARQAVVTAFVEAGYPITEADIVLPELQHGDVAVGCFRLGKTLGQAPAVIAAAAAEKISTSLPNERILSITAVGPYCNIRLLRDTLAEQTLRIIEEQTTSYGNVSSDTPQKIILEYVSPNTNKPLHLGHLRNALLGASVANLLEALGHKVIKTKIINDRGVHIMKSQIGYERWGNGETPESTNTKPDAFVVKWYVQFEKELQNNAALAGDAQALLQRWEAQDPDVRATWQQLRSWALAGHEQTYQRLGIHFDEQEFESEIFEEGRTIVLEALARGLVKKLEDGAIVIDLHKEGLKEKVLQRANGTTLYITQDMALAKRRIKKHHPDALVYVVGQEQDHQFKILFAILRRLNLVSHISLEHLSYKLVYLPEGKMKSREGTVVDTDEVLDHLKTLAQEEISKRDPELDASKVSERAEKIALAAAKYYFLKVRRTSDIHFDPKASLNFTGDTGPYLLYTVARINSVQKKAATEKITPKNEAIHITEVQWPLLLTLARWSDVVKTATEQREPSLVADYAMTLARAMNDMYEKEPVIKAEHPEEQSWRLGLLLNAKQVLENVLRVLGIETIATM